MALGATLQHLSGSLAQGLDGRGITIIPNPRVLDLLHQATKIGFALMANAKKTKQDMEAYKVDLFMASFFFVP